MQLTPNNIGHRWRKTREALGLPETMRYYDLRHYFATSCVLSGYNEEELKTAMGHTTSTFTHQIYVEMFAEHQAQVNARMAENISALYAKA